MNFASKTRRSVLSGQFATRGGTAQRRPGPLAVTFLLVLIWFAGAPWAWSRENSRSEYQVKAAFLFNFGEFIEWPSESFAGPESPFLVCVVGEDPFGPVLDQYLLGKKIGNHPVQIARFSNLKYLPESRSCQIVFFSASIRRYLPEVMDNFRGANVLLVGETPGFATSGGTIEFTLEEKHVRLTINTDAAERAGLRVSSKLLSLAKIVHGGTGNRRG